ncbi:MAG: PilN domain-containing protein [Bradyrhizobium sp.]|nr:PilN domain-containing protein [Bradyrhizobium sp.]
MSTLGDIADAFGVWIDTVARSWRPMLDRFKPSRNVRIVEQDDGALSVAITDGAAVEPAPPSFRPAAGFQDCELPQEWLERLRGSQVEIALQPSRFLFRPLDLPGRASEFLDGIVRSQIDRLTPWSAGEALYKWTAPIAIAGERITMTVAATARAAVAPLIGAIAEAGAAAIEVVTTTPGPDPVAITVYSHRDRANAQLGRVRQILLVIFAASGMAALGAMLTSGFLAPYYDDQAQQTQRQVAERRIKMRTGTAGPASSALELIERRKQSLPSSVIALEALSALLPDHTYATELRIEGDKIQVIGITRDAPSLIQLMEQSPHFMHASFFAPTTRAPNDPAERFHIEAKIKPHFGPGP